MSKLYDHPHKNHIINTRCIWVEKTDHKVDGNISAYVKLSIIYLPNSTANFIVEAKEALLERDTEAIGKMDPFVECKVGDVSSQTDVMDEAGKHPVWNQKLSYLLESIPNFIYITVKDKDLTSDDIVGSKRINPHEENWFVEHSEEVEREIEL